MSLAAIATKMHYFVDLVEYQVVKALQIIELTFYRDKIEELPD